MSIVRTMLIILTATSILGCCPNDEDSIRITGKKYSHRKDSYQVVQQFDEGRVKILAQKEDDYIIDPVIVSLGRYSLATYPRAGMQGRLHAEFLKPTDKIAYLLLSANFDRGGYWTELLSIELRRNTPDDEWVEISRNLIQLIGSRRWEIAFEREDGQMGCDLVAVPESVFYQSDDISLRKKVGIIYLVDSYNDGFVLNHSLYTTSIFWPD